VTQYLGQPAFWLGVVVVAIIVNIIWVKFFSGKGKLV
jgi:hypothetical protein